MNGRLRMQVCSFLLRGAFLRASADFLLRPRPQHWLARLCVSCSVLVTAAFAYLVPFGLQRSVLDLIGNEAWLVLGAAVTLALVGVLDSLVNDILPARFHMNWADKRRHQVYGTLALLLWTLVFLNALHGADGLLVMRYIVEGTACALVAIFDTVARYRQEQRARGLI